MKLKVYPHTRGKHKKSQISQAIDSIRKNCHIKTLKNPIYFVTNTKMGSTMNFIIELIEREDGCFITAVWNYVDQTFWLNLNLSLLLFVGTTSPYNCSWHA